MEQAKEAMVDVSNKLTNPVETVTNTAEVAKKFAKTQNGTIIVFAIAGVAIMFFLVLVVYWMLNRTVNNRKSHLITETKAPVIASKLQTFLADDVPSPGNGKRMSLSFWIYIHDLEKFKGLYKNVFFRGDANGKDASPEIVLDHTSNKMHVMFGTEGTDEFDGNSALLTTDTLKYDYKIQTRGITLDYIPIQRWVHIAIVVNEEVDGGTISGYIDGELVKIVRSTNAATKVGNVDVYTNLRLQNMNLDKRGNIYVGGSMDAAKPGFSGLVSKITFYNHDLNARDIYKVYVQGPVDGLASKLGAAYGVQSPLYRLG